MSVRRYFDIGKTVKTIFMRKSILFKHFVLSVFRKMCIGLKSFKITFFLMFFKKKIRRYKGFHRVYFYLYIY